MVWVADCVRSGSTVDVQTAVTTAWRSPEVSMELKLALIVPVPASHVTPSEPETEMTESRLVVGT